jgi:hypothetical protein
VKIGLAFWLLLAPGENWTWVIVGGHESRNACEQARNARLDGDRLVCASVQPREAEKGQRRPGSGVAHRSNTTAHEPVAPCHDIAAIADTDVVRRSAMATGSSRTVGMAVSTSLSLPVSPTPAARSARRLSRWQERALRTREAAEGAASRQQDKGGS